MSQSLSQPPKSPRNGDELIAVTVAIVAIGSILTWTLTHRDQTPSGPGLPGGVTQQKKPADPASTRLLSPVMPPEQPEAFSAIGRQMMPSSQPATGLSSNPSRNAGASQSSVTLLSQGLQESFEPIARPLSNLTTRSLRVPMPALPQSTLSSDVDVTGPPVEPMAFPDVSADHWAKSVIDRLSAQRWLQGFPDGSFRPEQPITRAEFAAQIAQAFSELPLESSESIRFRDVPETHWGQTSIQRAVQAGFLSGYPDQTFRPDQPVSRVQVMVAISSGLDLETDVTTDGALPAYQDRDQVPDWAISSLGAAIQSGLLADVGQITHLRPQAPATRAEVAAILYQALVYMGKVDPIRRTADD